MSDGTPTVADNDQDPVEAANAAAADAKAAGVPVDTIAFGTADGTVTVRGQDVPVPVDVNAMNDIANASGGKSFTAETASQLGSIYDAIGKDVAYETKTQEITALFAGIALLLAIAAAAAASNTIEELVVTAEKRSQSLQDVPVAISRQNGPDQGWGGSMRVPPTTTLQPSPCAVPMAAIILSNDGTVTSGAVPPGASAH